MSAANHPKSLALFIESTPGVMGGKPCIAGTRIDVKTVQFFASKGFSIEMINRAYPHLSRHQIAAAINYQPEPKGV